MYNTYEAQDESAMSATSFKSLVYDINQLDKNGNKILKPKPFVRNDRKL